MKKTLFFFLLITPFTLTYALDEATDYPVPTGPKPMQRVPLGPMGPMGPTQIPDNNMQIAPSIPSTTAQKKAYQAQQQKLQKEQEEMLEKQKIEEDAKLKKQKEQQNSEQK